MKKLLLAFLLFVSFNGFSQTVEQRLGLHNNGTPGKIYSDTIIPLPRTTLKYLTGYGSFGSLVDSINAVLAANKLPQTLTDGTTITWNAALGFNAQVTLGATGRTLSITNPVSGSYYTIRIIQDGGGSKTITTWPTNTKWLLATAPTLSTAAGKYDIVVFYYDGTNYYANYGLNYN